MVCRPTSLLVVEYQQWVSGLLMRCHLSKKIIIATIPLVGISTGKRVANVKTEGFAGEGCRAASEAFVKALGSQITEEATDEMYACNEQHERVNEG